MTNQCLNFKLVISHFLIYTPEDELKYGVIAFKLNKLNLNL